MQFLDYILTAGNVGKDGLDWSVTARREEPQESTKPTVSERRALPGLAQKIYIQAIRQKDNCLNISPQLGESVDRESVHQRKLSSP